MVVTRFGAPIIFVLLFLRTVFDRTSRVELEEGVKPLSQVGACRAVGRRSMPVVNHSWLALTQFDSPWSFAWA